MLRDIENLLESRGVLSTSDIALHFDMTASALTGMLRLLERKRRIHGLKRDCDSCSGCGPGDEIDGSDMLGWQIGSADD